MLLDFNNKDIPFTKKIHWLGTEKTSKDNKPTNSNILLRKYPVALQLWGEEGEKLCKIMKMIKSPSIYIILWWCQKNGFSLIKVKQVETINLNLFRAILITTHTFIHRLTHIYIHRLIHICTDLYSYAQTYTHMHRLTHICTDLHTFAQSYTHIHRLTHICTDLYTYAQTYTQLHRFTHICIDLHTYAQTYTHMHRLICTQKLFGLESEILI